jgi:hypothetical protein
MVIREYVEKLEGPDFVNAQARAWVDIREFMEEDVAPILAAQNQPGGSLNGPGSSLGCTEPLVLHLRELLDRHQISSLLDAPCGDWTWMRHVNLGRMIYVGWDVDIEQIQRNRDGFGTPRVTVTPDDPAGCFFFARNILTVPRLPVMDAILCRDFLAHLPTEHIELVLRKFADSGATYLLASSYPGVSNEFDYKPENFAWLGYCERPHDLEAAPFSMTKIDAIEEIPGPGGVIALPHELAVFRLR